MTGREKRAMMERQMAREAESKSKSAQKKMGTYKDIAPPPSQSSKNIKITPKSTLPKSVSPAGPAVKGPPKKRRDPNMQPLSGKNKPESYTYDRPPVYDLNTKGGRHRDSRRRDVNVAFELAMEKAEEPLIGRQYWYDENWPPPPEPRKVDGRKILENINFVGPRRPSKRSK